MTPAAASPWILTASGRRFLLDAPRPEDVHPEDLAHALAHLCRFGGHTRVHYSVAQHSVLVASLVPPRLALAGLLHDAAEAYVGDCVGPLAHRLPEFRTVELRILEVIGERFGVPFADFRAAEIRHADAVALLTERASFLPPSKEPWAEDLRGIRPLPGALEALPSHVAKARFLDRLRRLAGHPASQEA